jgi:hypothetical protein
VAYLGNDLQVAFPVYRNIDDISGSFNSVLKTFPLTVNGVAPVPAPLYSQQCLISVGGVVQRPDDSGSEGFRLSGSNIVFASAPSTGADFFGIILAGADYVNAGGNFPSGSAAVPSITFSDDLDTGIYNSGVNQLSIATSGTERLRIDSAGQIESVSLGTAAAPAFSFTTDSNTGIYSPGADQVAISTNGVERVEFGTGEVVFNDGGENYDFRIEGDTNASLLFVDASTERVGIGTASPSNILEVAGSAPGAEHIIRFRNTGTTAGSQSTLLLTTQTNSTNPCTSNISSLALDTSGNSALTFATATTGSTSERMRLDSSGRLGLGTSSPDAALSVVGTSNGLLAKFGGNSAVYSRALQINEFAVSGTNNVGFQLNSPGASGQAALSFATQGTNRIYIDNDGRVGIGTTSPGYTLDVAPGSAGDAIRLRGGSGGTGVLQFTDSTASAQWGTITTTSSSLDATHSSAVRFLTASSERARIDSSGRLLVGTSTAFGQGLLQVNSNTSIGSYFASAFSNAFYFVKSRSATAGQFTVVQSGDELGQLLFQGTDGTTNITAASILAAVDGTPGTNDMPGRLVFSTTADGASSPTERMRIAQNGVITIQNGAVAVIGTLTDGATITPDFAADCNFTVTLGGARTIANPTNITAGQSGSIFLVQDATGSRTAAWGSYWDFPGGTAPTLSTAANAVDRIDYVVRTSTSIHTVFTANYS